MISFERALQLTLDHIPVLEMEDVSLLNAVDRITAVDLTGRVDSPSANVSLKDGYAIQSADIAKAREDAAVLLRVVGAVAAGSLWSGQLRPGEAVRILSGAPIPFGADAVIAEEFTRLSGDTLYVLNDAHTGRNILPQASDIRKGNQLVSKGSMLSPPTVGLLAAAGYRNIPVVKQPSVAILATGDEVVAPGEPLLPGRLYASNLVTLGAWCRRYAFTVETFVVKDDARLIREKLQACLRTFDAVITSGGAWRSERDMVVRMLDELNWRKYYHRVRMGPGKAAAFGIYEDKKPVFCLPGGPPSNHIAFLQLALPGLQVLSGKWDTGLPVRKVRLAEPISGRVDWTQFKHGKLEAGDDLALFHPLNPPSRLQMMAESDAIVRIPEGISRVEKDQVIEGQLLRYRINT